MKRTGGSIPPSAGRVRTLEAHFGVRFPAEYKKFLERHNGTHVADGAIDALGGGLVIERFPPILDDFPEHPDGWADIAIVVTQLDARISSDPDSPGLAVIPIAALFGGDMLVLDYRGAADTPAGGPVGSRGVGRLQPAVRPVMADFAALAHQLTGAA